MTLIYLNNKLAHTPVAQDSEYHEFNLEIDFTCIQDTITKYGA